MSRATEAELIAAIRAKHAGEATPHVDLLIEVAAGMWFAFSVWGAGKFFGWW